MDTPHESHEDGRFRIPFWLGTCAFMVIAVFFLWEEHRAHLLGVLPFLLLITCSLLHFFMHRGHSGASHEGHRRQ